MVYNLKRKEYPEGEIVFRSQPGVYGVLHTCASLSKHAAWEVACTLRMHGLGQAGSHRECGTSQFLGLRFL